MEWNKITDSLHSCKVKVKGKEHIFTLKLQDIGVYGFGKALILRGKIDGDKMEVLGSLWLKDDGYHRYKQDGHKKQLWTVESAKKESFEIIKNIIENIY